MSLLSLGFSLPYLSSFLATVNMESVTGWAAKGTGGDTLWLMAGDTKAAVTAFAVGRGTIGVVSLGFSPMFFEVWWLMAGRDGALISSWEPTLGPIYAGLTFHFKQTNKQKKTPQPIKSRILLIRYNSFSKNGTCLPSFLSPGGIPIPLRYSETNSQQQQQRPLYMMDALYLLNHRCNRQFILLTTGNTSPCGFISI